MSDRAVFMRQRFCDEIRRTHYSHNKSTTVINNAAANGKPSHTTAADVRPQTWLQLAPAQSKVAAPAEAIVEEDNHFLSNSASAGTSRASSFSSERSVVQG